MELNKQVLYIHNKIHRPLKAQPVTMGIPWPQGIYNDISEFAAYDEEGKAISCAFSVLNRWRDGSIQWVLFDMPLDFFPSGTRKINFAPASVPAPSPRFPVIVSRENGCVSIQNGLVEIVFSEKEKVLIKSWKIAGKEFVRSNGMDVTFEDENGKVYSFSSTRKRIIVEHYNNCRSVIRLEGKHYCEEIDKELLDVFMRFEIFAGREDVRITWAFRNRELPVPGIKIKNVRIRIKTTLSEDADRCFTANNLTRHYLTKNLRVKEDPIIVASDTGDIEHYVSTHKENARADCFVRNPEVLHDPPEIKPWFLQDPKFRFQAGGNKCVWPYLALISPQGGVVAAFEAMTSLYPKQISVEKSDFILDIWPAWAGLLNITQGAGRSQRFFIGPLPAEASDCDIQNVYLSWELGGLYTHVPAASTLEIKPDLSHVRRCNVFAINKLPEYMPEKRFLFERKLLDAWIGVSYGQLGAVDQVQPHKASGFWSYGDENASNNEEMHGLVYFQNYFRSGNWGCAEYALALAKHIMEVDYVDFSIDPFQNKGMVSHCLHHNDGAAYPSHMWFTELLFAYVITGDVEYKCTALNICENLLYWINNPEGFSIISADQREAGQPMINLTWCYNFNPDPRYLDGCRKIINNLMEKSEKYGRMLDPKPFTAPVKIVSYGDYASWEGMFWFWEITKDEEVKKFMLKELEWRLTPEYSGVHGFHRCTDYNPAAYAYYMTGNKQWLERVAYPFRAAFKAAKWPIGWVHSMYYIKLAFDFGIVKDEDIIVQ